MQTNLKYILYRLTFVQFSPLDINYEEEKTLHKPTCYSSKQYFVQTNGHIHQIMSSEDFAFS